MAILILRRGALSTCNINKVLLVSATWNVLILCLPHCIARFGLGCCMPYCMGSRQILWYVWCLPHGLCGFFVCHTAGSDLQRTSVWPVSSFQMPSEGKVAQTEFGKKKVVRKVFPNLIHVWQNKIYHEYFTPTKGSSYATSKKLIATEGWTFGRLKDGRSTNKPTIKALL